jgi:hypothetical protein
MKRFFIVFLAMSFCLPVFAREKVEGVISVKVSEIKITGKDLAVTYEITNQGKEVFFTVPWNVTCLGTPKLFRQSESYVVILHCMIHPVPSAVTDYSVRIEPGQTVVKTNRFDGDCYTMTKESLLPKGKNAFYFYHNPAPLFIWPAGEYEYSLDGGVGGRVGNDKADKYFSFQAKGRVAVRSCESGESDKSAIIRVGMKIEAAEAILKRFGITERMPVQKLPTPDPNGGYLKEIAAYEMGSNTIVYFFIEKLTGDRIVKSIRIGNKQPKSKGGREHDWEVKEIDVEKILDPSFNFNSKTIVSRLSESVWFTDKNNPRNYHIVNVDDATGTATMPFTA